jgi:hypothetical protein
MESARIIELLENKTKYKGLKLPAYIDFHIDNKVLSIVLNSRDSKQGKVFSCTANMQTDEAAFEGWSICLKHHLSEFIDSVVLKWEQPNQLLDNQQLHYNRFLYRVTHFKQMFDWFDVDETNNKDLEEFYMQLTDLVINTPLNESSEPSEQSSKEKQIEFKAHNLNALKEKFQLQYINHQLPVGVQKKGKSFFTGHASAIDIWGIDHCDNLNIFELKYANKKVGIISELLFYSEVMYDVFISNKIGKPSSIKKIRHAEHLYGNETLHIKSIKSFFLFDKLHPLVIGTTALLNTNNFGIKFLKVQYKLKKDTFLFDAVYYKGALQMEEEIGQSTFRKTAGLNGNAFLLFNGDENLHESIREEAKTYFKDNSIDWWAFDGLKTKPTKHLVSSQIQCINYLFALRQDKDAILKLAQLFDSAVDDVLPTIGDKDVGYIAFEFVYENDKLLNENDWGAKRGSFCTSVDAFIIATRQGKKLLIPIEWKYTENYFDSHNKALEAKKGTTRQTRYNHLIENSKQLKSASDIENSVYYYEPFYEFMRQTLLVEQMVKVGIAEDYLHVVVIPAQNLDLLGNNYSFSTQDLKTTWNNCLHHQSKFKIIDSKTVFNFIAQLPEYNKLTEYLKARYF